MNSKYNYYEEVIVKTNKKHLAKYNGRKAVITGKSNDEEDPTIWAYSVAISGEEESFFVFEEDLYPTGNFAKKEDFYTGERVRVKVSQAGEGNISGHYDKNGKYTDANNPEFHKIFEENDNDNK